jgi:hypothetical protein
MQHEVIARSPPQPDGLAGLMQSQQWNLIPPAGPGIDMFSPSFALDGFGTSGWHGGEFTNEADFRYGLLDIDGWDYIPVSID